MAPASRYHDSEYASVYDADRFGGRFGGALERHEVELYRSLLAEASGSLLDAGCGTGKISLPFLDAGWMVVSADFSAEMLRQARDKARTRGLPLRPVLTDIQNLGFEDRVFGGVISSRALMHVPDWRAGLKELCRVCDDTLVMDVPPSWSSSGLDALRRRLVNLLPGREGHPYRTFTRRQVSRELGLHGFQVRRKERSWLLPVAVHRRLDRPGLSQWLEKTARTLGLTRLLGAPLTLQARRTGR